MGDPKKQKKKYRKPLMIWDETLIKEQAKLTEEFGLKNKKEIWKAESKLKSIHDQAKKLIAESTPQSEKESEQLIKKLSSLALIPPAAKLEDILSLTVQDLLNRRLQTLVLKKGLARTIKQSRQFITHNHVSIADQTINIPSYMTKANEELKITFNSSSTISNEEHPERFKEETKEKEKILAKPREIRAKEAKTPSKEAKKEPIKKEEPNNQEKPVKKEETATKIKENGKKVVSSKETPKPTEIPKEQIDNTTPEEKPAPKEK